MKTMIRNLVVAVPLTFATLTMAPVPAFATDPVIVLPPAEPDPAPMDIAIPKPGPVQPDGPDQIAPPKPKPAQPDGPDTLANPEPGPVVDPGNPTPEPADPTTDPTEPAADPAVDPTADPSVDPTTDPGTDTATETDPAPAFEQVAVPTDDDTDLAPAIENTDDNLALALLVAGGVLVTVSGAAFVARRRTRRTA
jgi:hypothetical protein